MRRRKLSWIRTTIPERTKIKLWRLMIGTPTYPGWYMAIDAELNKYREWEDTVSRNDIESHSMFDRFDIKFVASSRETYNLLYEEIMQMPLDFVIKLPPDLQSWIRQLRPELESETYPRRKADEPDIESVVTQLKARLCVPPPEDILISSFGGPGRHRIYFKQDTIKVIQENLGYGISMFKTMRESSSAGSGEIILEVSKYGDLKLCCLDKEKNYELSKKLISSLSETAQQKLETWEQRGGNEYLGGCSEIYRGIHIEARNKTGHSIIDAVFSKLGAPPAVTLLFGDLVYQLCILYRRSRGQYGLPPRGRYQIKRSGLLFSELYLGKLHLASAPFSPPPPPPPPPRLPFLPPPPPPPSLPNLLETWTDLHRNMIKNRGASSAVIKLLTLFDDLRGIEATIKQELDDLIRGK